MTGSWRAPAGAPRKVTDVRGRAFCKRLCYYRAPYEGGAAFLLVQDAKVVRARADFSAQSVVNRFTDFICHWDANHRHALEAYLRYKGYSFVVAGSVLRASSPKGQSLTARFDDLGRLSRIEAVISPPRQSQTS